MIFLNVATDSRSKCDAEELKLASETAISRQPETSQKKRKATPSASAKKPKVIGIVAVSLPFTAAVNYFS